MSLFVEKAGEASFLAFEGELPRKEFEQVLKNVIEQHNHLLSTNHDYIPWSYTSSHI